MVCFALAAKISATNMMSINSTGNTYLSESFSYDDEGDLKYSATMPARGVPVQYLQDHIKKMQENNLFVRDYNVSTRLPCRLAVYPFSIYRTISRKCRRITSLSGITMWV